MSEQQRPRLADILGVEVGERFTIKGFHSTTKFWVTENGRYETEPIQDEGSSYAILDAINHPSLIQHCSPLTKQEIDICKKLGAAYISRDEKSCEGDWVELWNKRPEGRRNSVGKLYYSAIEDGYMLAQVRPEGFPSVKPGKCLEVPNA